MIDRDPVVVALDVGGSTIKAAAVGHDGTATARLREPTPVVEDLADTVADIVERLRGDLTISGIGLAAPGIVDEIAGVVDRSTNLGIDHLPLRALVEERTGARVALVQDVRAAAHFEHRCGAGAGVDDLVYVAIGTGIGAMLFVGGQAVDRGGHAGELGHVDVGHHEMCSCGARGCLEAVASAGAIARRYSARTGRRVDGAREVAEAASSGDPDATAVWNEAVTGLAHALAWVASVLAPERVVIGGGLSLAGSQLLEPLDAALRAKLTFQQVPAILPARFGDESGCLGAAAIALSRDHCA